MCTRMHLGTHACSHTHAYMQTEVVTGPRGHTSRGLQGSVGQMPAPGLCLVPAPTPSPPAQTAQGRHSSQRGLGVETTGSSEAFSPHFKHHQAKCCCISQQPRTGLQGEKLFSQNEGETLLKRKHSADLAAVAVCRLFPVRDFFYSIFLAVSRPCLLRGGSDPASQGLVRHRRPSVPCARVWPHPNRHHQHLPRGSRDAPRCPLGPLPAAKPPRSETAWLGWPGGCAAAGFRSVPRQEGL